MRIEGGLNRGGGREVTTEEGGERFEQGGVEGGLNRRRLREV